MRYEFIKNLIFASCGERTLFKGVLSRIPILSWISLVLLLSLFQGVFQINSLVINAGQMENEVTCASSTIELKPASLLQQFTIKQMVPKKSEICMQDPTCYHAYDRLACVTIMPLSIYWYTYQC